MTALTLFDTQKKQLIYALKKARSLDCSEMGTGKTPPACIYTKYMVEREQIRVIWVSTKSIHEKNKLELMAWTGLSSDDITIIPDGATVEKKEKAALKDSKVWLMTVEFFNKNLKLMLGKYPNIKGVIVDEAHLYFANWESKRSQTFLKLIKYMDRVHVMTATHVKSGKLTNSYFFVHFLNPMYYATYADFKQTHEVKDLMGNVVGYRNHHVLKEFFDKYAIKFSVKEVYGDIPTVLQRVPFEMLPAQRKAYDKLRSEGILELENSIIEDTNGGLTALRLRQITNHPHKIALPVDWDRKGKIIDYAEEVIYTGTTPKQQYILEFLQTTQDQVAIFAPFVYEQEALFEFLSNQGYRCGLINASVSAARRAEIDRMFQAGDLDVIVASPKTAGIGFNWSKLNHIIFHSLDYGDDDFKQALARAKRGKRDTPLLVHLLEYDDSSDQYMMWGVYHKSVNTNLVDSKSEIVRFPRPRDPNDAFIWSSKMEFS